MFENCLLSLCQKQLETTIPDTHPLFNNKSLRNIIIDTTFCRVKSSDLKCISIAEKSNSCVSVILDNETIYKGEVKDRKAHDPNALVIFNDGSYYFGGVEKGVIQGKGCYKFADQTYSYSGEWKNGLPQGKGVQVSPCGVYEGEFKAGKKWGSGKLVFPDGSEFIGEFIKNGIQGNGIFRSQKYFAKGNWVNGFLEGPGMQNYEDGSHYMGQFKNGKPHGSGTFTLFNNQVYIGNFQNGKPVGKGIYYQNNKAYQANWNNNQIMSLSISLYSLLTKRGGDASPLSQLSKISK